MTSPRALKALFITLVVNLGIYISPPAQAAFSDEDNCSKYYDIENELHCGPDSYLQEFAKPYCEEYLSKNSYFNSDSQEILRNIRQCLQNSVIRRSDLTCENIGEIGIASHYDCYIQSGFCDMDHDDKLLVMWIAREQAFNWPVLRIFLKVEEYCSCGNVNP